MTKAKTVTEEKDRKSLTLYCSLEAYALATRAAEAEERSLCNFVRVAVAERAKRVLAEAPNASTQS